MYPHLKRIGQSKRKDKIMSKTAKCTRNSQIQRNIQNGSYVHNGRFRDYGTLPEDIPSWDYRVRRQGEMLARVERKIRKAK